jgi:hypothetical protein
MKLIDQTARLLRQGASLYDSVFLAPFRRTARRHVAVEEDLFMLLCFSESLGLPNSVSYYTLELYPYLIDDFHRWHRKMGIEHSPLDEIKCC